MGEVTGTDDPIIAAQNRVRQLRSQLECASLPERPRLLSPRSPKQTACVRCGASLPLDRLMQCATCDEMVAREIAEKVARETEATAAARLQRSGLPIDYRAGSRIFGSLPVTPAHSFLPHLGKGQARGLYLHGSAGSFKTSVAASWLAIAMAIGTSGTYAFVPDLMADIHLSYREEGGGESRSAITERLVSVPCLVLDDIGKEKASEHGAGIIFEIADGRYRSWTEGRWMIVTSNWSLDALCDRFPDHLGDPIRRRLAEMCVQVAM